MKKILSLVLSISILTSSIAPSFAGGPKLTGKMGRVRVHPISIKGKPISTEVVRKVIRQVYHPKSPLETQILMGHVDGVAEYILKKSGTQKAPLMRNEFVRLSFVQQAISRRQRLEAVSHYTGQLADAQIALKAPENTGLSSVLSSHVETIETSLNNARKSMADASALGLVGDATQAPVLLAFYRKAKGSLFEDTSTLITARGLLRMQAYEELGALLKENAQNPVLSGVAEYVTAHQLPVEVPASLKGLTPKKVEAALAEFLEQDARFNRLHADASLQATEQWMALGQEGALTTTTGNLASGAFSHPIVSSTEPAPKTPALNEGAPIKQEKAPAATPRPLDQSSSESPVSSATTAGTIPSPQQAATSATTTPVRKASPARSGIVYGGIPFFALTDAVSGLWRKVRNYFKKKADRRAPYEEPGLHENKVRPIYEKVEEPVVADGGEAPAVLQGGEEVISVGADGFQFTIENENNVEHILHHVNLTISSALKNFSSEYNRLALSLGNVFELRNQTLPAKRPDHFYFVLSSSKGEFSLLTQGADKLGLSRPLRVKIQRSASPKTTVTLPIFRMLEDGTLQETRVVAEVDLALLGTKKAKLAQGGRIVLKGNEIYYRNKEGKLETLKDAFVRLPKEESKYWARILAMYPQTRFEIGVLSTEDKMPPLTFMVPCLQIGLGKTMGPVLKEHSAMSETEATYLMMGINNVIPGLMVFVNPLLDRYGEARVYRLGVASLAASALGAIASGLYGHLNGVFSGGQLAAFLASSTLMALGVSVTRYLQGLLILANRGIVRDGSSFKDVKTGAKVDVIYNAKYLRQRLKEVFTKKSEKSLRDVLNLQKAAMYKNFGTMLFLAFPWLANLTGKAFGVDLGLDFSASYVPYSLFSLYTLYKVYKTPFKNSVPLDLTMLRNNFRDLQGKLFPDVAKLDVEKITPQHAEVLRIANAVKESIATVVSVEARKTKEAPRSLTLKYEAEFEAALEQFLRKEGRSAEEAGKIRQIFKQTFDELGHRNVNLKDVLFKVGVPASLTAMTLATLGELGFSNNFAFAMRELVGSATAATGIVGLLLYGFMFAWRIVGNFLSQRMSGGSMYAISSATAILGPLAMAFSHGNMPALMTGAIISCFGISNFFAQMYNYIIKLHPKYKREVALLINTTMPISALGAPLLRLAGHIPGLDMALVSAAMAGSVFLTPTMLADSSLVQFMKYSWNNAKNRLKTLLNRRRNGGDEPPLIENPAQ